jgi:hypothetical protein
MRVWLIGADRGGVKALQQLAKNEDIDVIVSAREERPQAMSEGLIDHVDYVEFVTPANVNTLARRIRPDLILIDSAADERAYGRMSGGLVFSDSMVNEIAAVCDYPCLIV